MSESPVALYRLFDRAGELLYIGITSSPSARMSAHRRDKRWWVEVDAARTTFQWLSSRPEAERAEVEAISSDAPRYNVADNPAQRGDMIARARAVALASMAARRFESDDWLAAADDIEAVTDPAERARRAGQQLVEVPDLQRKLRLIRQAAVKEMKAEGMTNADVARVLGVHRNRIQQIAEGRPGGGKGAKPQTEA